MAKQAPAIKNGRIQVLAIASKSGIMPNPVRVRALYSRSRPSTESCVSTLTTPQWRWHYTIGTTRVGRSALSYASEPPPQACRVNNVSSNVYVSDNASGLQDIRYCNLFAFRTQSEASSAFALPVRDRSRSQRNPTLCVAINADSR